MEKVFFVWIVSVDLVMDRKRNKAMYNSPYIMRIYISFSQYKHYNSVIPEIRNLLEKEEDRLLVIVLSMEMS